MNKILLRRIIILFISLYITYHYVVYFAELDYNLYNYAQIFIIACIEVIFASVGLAHTLVWLIKKGGCKYEF